MTLFRGIDETVATETLGVLGGTLLLTVLISSQDGSGERL